MENHNEKSGFSVKDMTKTVIMIALIAVCSWISVPSAVPFTLQTFAVFFALLVLGGKKGIIAVSVYVLMGGIGLPVFAGFQGGIGHLIGPTGGYILGFILTAVCYLIFEGFTEKHFLLTFPVLLSGLILCYLVGTLWFAAVYVGRGTEYSIPTVLSLCVLPYVIPDIVKLLLAMFIYKRIRKFL